MVKLHVLRKLCKEKKIQLKELADAIDISENGLQKMINNNTTKIETLEKIANYLDVPIAYFFDSQIDNPIKGDVNKNQEYIIIEERKLIAELQKSIELQNIIIKNQNITIENYEKRMKNWSGK